MRRLYSCCLVPVLLLVVFHDQSCVRAQRQPTLGLADGFISFETPSFSVQLVKDSQTLASLRPKPAFQNNAGFDFVPNDQLSLRQFDGNYHVGDITFRARKVNSSSWIEGNTAASRKRVSALPTSGTTLAAADLTPTLPASSLLKITRRWSLDSGSERLQLLFDVHNPQSYAVEIGSIGIPQEWNNIFTGRSASDVNQNCSLFDPYIGMDAGYVQVTPLIGTSGALVITPVGKTPLEGWRFLNENTSNAPFYQSQTFEGLYEWQVHTLAYAENEWAQINPWNNPTSAVLEPGDTRIYGLQFSLSPSIRDIEVTVRDTGAPVAVGLPGYILTMDQVAKLFLNYSFSVDSVSVSPANALTWKTNNDSSTWTGLDILASAWGRSRLTITYTDQTVQTVHYYIQEPGTTTIANLGHFLTTAQWYTNDKDPFGRSPSVLSYDRSINQVLINEQRAWIAGLSDEAGAGSWLAATMKQYVQPSETEIRKLQQFAEKTLNGVIQNNNGTVKKSVFFYQPGAVNWTYPSDINWGNWWSWNQAAAYAYDRAYDYVHVTAAWWAMYRVARNYPDSVTLNSTTQLGSWQSYLSKAFNTVLTMMTPSNRVGFIDDGLMGETVFRFLLDDLMREGWTTNASALENEMKSRYTIWSRERFPFGSEMAWDSTGQEGVYLWAKFFNDSNTKLNALNSILAYQPTVAHWGYNGNARRYWDNIYGGKLMRYERQIHHYGSGLNALPLITEFMSSPTDYYLLRVGFGGLSGPLSNIDQQGFASASFHSFADTLAWDAYSGDYGPNFVGHSLGMAAFIIDHPEFGWQAFGGNILSKSPTVSVQIVDTVRRRIFFAPVGILFNLDAGAFSSFNWDPTSKQISLHILSTPNGSLSAAAPVARIMTTQTAVIPGVVSIRPLESLKTDSGAYVVAFGGGAADVTFVIS